MTIPTIYVDTSCLRGLSLKNPDWQALLKISERGALKIEISEVAFQERCSNWRDSLKSDASNVKNAIDKSIDTWNKTPVTGESKLSDNPYFLVNIQLENFEEDVENKVCEHAGDFLSQHNIGVRSIREHHAKEVWRKYTNWEEPFYKPTQDRSNKNVREKRKTHIPDAWIIEDAIALHKECEALYVLSKDEKMSQTLLSTGVKVFKEPGEIVLELKKIQSEEGLTDVDKTDTSIEAKSDIPQDLAALIDTRLIEQVLG